MHGIQRDADTALGLAFLLSLIVVVSLVGGIVAIIVAVVS